ncbi:MAG: hypothetical protein IPH41_17490 [Sulfuritalea sp.]|nr:hypothetical protein [Sulfuritalea sp.]
MSWTLVTTVSVDRRTRKLLARHPDLRPWLADTLEKLHSIDPRARPAPSLTHRTPSI